LVCEIKERTHTEGILEHVAEENIGTEEGRGDRSLETTA
jgi:hypothetical protein